MTNSDIILDAVDAPNNLFTRTAVTAVVAVTHLPAKITFNRRAKKAARETIESIHAEQDEMNRRGYC